MANVVIDIDPGELIRAGREQGAAKLQRGSVRRGLNLNLAKAAERILRRHFRQRNRTPNRLGGQRTNFWSQIERNTSVNIAETDQDRAVVTVADRRFNLKVYGGRVEPVAADALTIPVHALAHGRRVAELRSRGYEIFKPLGKDYLAAIINGEFTVLYLLRTHTDHQPDPEALPEDAAFENDLSDAAEAYLETL